MSLLLSSQALIDLAANDSKVQGITKDVDKSSMFLSVISIGVARWSVETLAQTSAARIGLLANIDVIVSSIEDKDNLRVVDKGVVLQWLWLSKIALSDKNNRPISLETRLVIATAFDANFTLITRDEPWVHELTPLRLQATVY